MTHKYTTVSGKNANGDIVVKGRNCHWKLDTISNVARKAGIIGSAKVNHAILGGKEWQRSEKTTTIEV